MQRWPTTPVAQLIMIAGLVACLVMLFVSQVVGFAILVVTLVVGVALRLIGIK